MSVSITHTSMNIVRAEITLLAVVIGLIMADVLLLANICCQH